MRRCQDLRRLFFASCLPTMSGFSKITQAFKDLPADLSHIKKKVEKLPSAMSKAKETLECEPSPHLLETKN